jgi:hypothetical protein
VGFSTPPAGYVANMDDTQQGGHAISVARPPAVAITTPAAAPVPGPMIIIPVARPPARG